MIYSDLPFLPGRMRIQKCRKLICNLYDKEKNSVHARTIK